MPVERTPPKPFRPSEVRLRFAEDFKARASRRTRDLPPEFRPLPQTPKKKTATMSTPPVVILPVTPRTPTPFHGEAHEDVEDWLQHYERVAHQKGWKPEQCLQNVHFVLEATARNWFENHEASITSWEQLKAELRGTFTNQQRRERAEELLQARIQGPNESVVSFVEDVLRLSNRANPQASEAKKLRMLMRGITENIFGGLVRCPPTTVETFVTDATNIERAMQARAALVDTGADYSALSGRLSQRLRKVTTPWDGLQIRTAGGHLITPVRRCTARFEIHGETCPVKFVVLRDCARNVILGMGFLGEYSAVIDLEANQLTLRKPVMTSVNQERTSAASATMRVLSEHVNLPPRSSVLVPVRTETAICGDALLEGNVQLLLGREVGVARGITKLQDGRTTVLVTNFRQEAQHLTKGIAVGHIEDLQDTAAIAEFSEDSPSSQHETASSSKLDIDPILPLPH
ncbi:hypothetical protein ISCGN_009757 [Ixodes scapularis]